MKRLPMLLAVLLIVTNATWLILWTGTPDHAGAPVPESQRTQDREEIRLLRARIDEMEGPSRGEQRGKGVGTEEPPGVREGRPRAVPGQRSTHNRPAPATRLSDEVRTAANKLREGWVKDAQQLSDPSKRDRAIGTIKAALKSPEPAENLAAIQALWGLYSVEFDRASFRPLVRHFFTHEDPAVRRDALNAYASIGGGAEGLHDLRVLLDDPDLQVRLASAGVLFRATDYKLENEAADAYLKLLADEDNKVVNAALGALRFWKSISPEMEDRLIEMATGDESYSTRLALQAISGGSPKTRRTVDVLIEVLSNPSYNARFPAYQGLKSGVPDSEQRRVADAVLAVIAETGYVNDHISCFQILNVCADETHLPAIRSFLDNPMLSEESRRHLSRYVTRIEKRLEGE